MRIRNWKWLKCCTTVKFHINLYEFIKIARGYLISLFVCWLAGWFIGLLAD